MKIHHLTQLPAIVLAAMIAIQPCNTHAASASPPELLEKGIYTEETKGDLDAAIAIYQQLTAEAKASQSLAAQAQLRLGQCYLKKNRNAEAIAAFEKLIRDFPNEKDLVAKARAYLPGELALDPVSWEDGERLTLVLTLAAGMEIGAMELRADLAESAGKKVWRVGRRMSGGGQMLSRAEVDAQTFQPITSYWKHTLLGEVSAVFKPGEVEMKKTGSTETTKIQTDKTIFDNEECFHLIRRLPLKEGYKVTLSVLPTLAGGAVIPIECEVVKKETLDVPAGKFDCFKVQLSIGQALWYSDDAHRYLVKFEGGGAIGLLAAIGKRQPGNRVAFRDDELGVSLAAPADWVIRKGSAERKGRRAIHLLDAAASADGIVLELQSTESLAAPLRQSARAWADDDLRDFAKALQDLKVRANGWQSANVFGRLGVSFIADYVESGKPKVLYTLYAVGVKTSEKFVLTCAADQFDALKPAFDGIIASYRMTK